MAGMIERRVAWKGAVAGAVGGLAASLAIDFAQALFRRVAQRREQQRVAREERWWQRRVSQAHRPTPPPEPGTTEQPQARASLESEHRVAMRLAAVISERVFHHRMTGLEKRIFAPVVLHSYGMLLGAVYGALAERQPKAALGAGLPFGAALWFVQDELLAPLLRLSGPPTQYRLSEHAGGFAAHAVYGAMTDGIRRGVRALLG